MGAIHNSLCRPVDSKRPGTWRRFSLRELHAATNNFNYDNKLGEGIMGSVYWGQLASGDQVCQPNPSDGILHAFDFQVNGKNYSTSREINKISVCRLL